MQNIVSQLKAGKIYVIPTDTIYGIVGSALLPQTVARIYKLRKRNSKKPMIILIGSLDDLFLFGIRPNSQTQKLINSFWPGKVSIILPLPKNPALIKKFRYLHRGSNSLAFRLPKLLWLRMLLKKTGPLVAPSANWEGYSPAHTIKNAKKYFKNNVDGYLDKGNRKGNPSKLIKMEAGKAVVIRA